MGDKENEKLERADSNMAISLDEEIRTLRGLKAIIDAQRDIVNRRDMEIKQYWNPTNPTGEIDINKIDDSRNYAIDQRSLLEGMIRLDTAQQKYVCALESALQIRGVSI